MLLFDDNEFQTGLRSCIDNLHYKGWSERFFLQIKNVFLLNFWGEMKNYPIILVWPDEAVRFKIET